MEFLKFGIIDGGGGGGGVGKELLEIEGKPEVEVEWICNGERLMVFHHLFSLCLYVCSAILCSK